MITGRKCSGVSTNGCTHTHGSSQSLLSSLHLMRIQFCFLWLSIWRAVWLHMSTATFHFIKNSEIKKLIRYISFTITFSHNMCKCNWKYTVSQLLHKLWDSRFSYYCWKILPPSGIWHCVYWYRVTNQEH